MSEVNKYSDYNISDFLNNQKMSAAVMSSTMYDFADLLYKHQQQQNNSNNNSSTTSPRQQQQQQHNNINLQSHHAKVLRWGAVGAPAASNATTTAPTSQHATISRRNSSPAPTPAQISSLVHSVQNIILDNIREQQQQQQQQQQQPQLHRKLDRSQSEPCSSALLAAANAKAANINTSRYKTELCRPFEESGSCKYGDKCQFAHGGHELRNLVRHPKYKTELCRTFHTIGFCPYGPRCHFIHNAEEARTKCPLMQGASSRNPPDLKPLYLGSTAESPSPPSSLSQSPTTSVGSFFSSETELFPGPQQPGSPPAGNTAFSFGEGFRPLVLGGRRSPPQSPPSPPAGSPPPSSPEARLPVFNKLHMFPGLQAGN